MGANVASTITKGIIKPEKYTSEPELFAICFPGVLAGSSLSMIMATIYGIPVSSSHAVVFGLVAVGLASKGGDSIGTGGIL